MKILEQIVIRLDRQPLAGALRIVVGYAIGLLWWVVLPGNQSGWTLAGTLVATLFLLRLVPAFVRRVVPFSDAARVEWAERRHLAKRFDSYQWQKLLWIGLGLGGFAWQVGGRSRSVTALAVVLVIAGTVGLAIWRRQTPR